jgi:hypothetical protein
MGERREMRLSECDIRGTKRRYFFCLARAAAAASFLRVSAADFCAPSSGPPDFFDFTLSESGRIDRQGERYS